MKIALLIPMLVITLAAFSQKVDSIVYVSLVVKYKPVTIA